MNRDFDLSVEVSKPYPFSKAALEEIGMNPWVKNQWPLVYFIQNHQQRIAYVGESTNALYRLKNHLQNSERTKLNQVSIIGSDKFNKSATLDIESKLIQYLSGEGTYTLQNGNFGLINHNYYQQDLYKGLFNRIWDSLIEKRLVSKSMEEIRNTALFKFSPYKSLNEDQYASVMQILDVLAGKGSNHIFISGSAGTGKTVVATYMMKLLTTKVDAVDLEELNEDEMKEIGLIQAIQNKFPNLKIGLVVAMTSLRESLQEVFRKVPGLKANMVMSPADVTKLKGKYDLLIVDEAHRLRQYRNIGWMGPFKKINRKLGFNDEGTELDWILAKSHNQIFFYDAAQSVKPSDVPSEKFHRILNQTKTIRLELKSQMRVKGGSNYISFVDELLHVRRRSHKKFEMPEYELLLFDSLEDLYRQLMEQEEKYELCRLVAGYAWPWASKNDKKAFDIEIDGLSFQWNTTDKDWVNSPSAYKEVGCIHTTQGYDLNYTGVIFGPEITYNPTRDKIEIIPANYHDNYGKAGVKDVEDLKAYIINIYKTLMYRGIRGTYLYAWDPGLREYLRRHVVTYQAPMPFRVLHGKEIKPYVNALPLLNINVAAGSFSEPIIDEDCEWVVPPAHVKIREGYFICQVKGESMNKVIPNGSYCLFKKDTGGSRNGKIVLVASKHISDPEYAPGYTVKEYWSEKQIDEDGWRHKVIRLIPRSADKGYQTIELDPEQDVYKILGLFEQLF